MKYFVSRLPLRCLLALALLSAAAPAPAAGEDARIRLSLSALVASGTLAARPEFEALLVAGQVIPGEQVAPLLIRLAAVFKPVTTTADAVTVLSEHGIIRSTDYWSKGTAAGGKCDGGNLATVIGRVAGRLPVPPPPSAKASPLSPTPAVSLQKSYDVVIAGAGTGGCGAAVQAARMGRTVLLLEETDWVGGQMNAAAVTSMDEGRVLVRERGLYRELCGLINAHYQPLGINAETAYWHGHMCVEPRVGQVLLLKMLADAKGTGTLDLALRSRVSKVDKDGNTVTGVDIESVTPQGRNTQHIACKILIDATEWGDVIPLTGARYRTGNCTSDAIDRSRHTQDLTWTVVVKQYPDGVPPELVVAPQPPDYEKYHKRFAKSVVVGDPNDFKPVPKGDPWTWNWYIGYRGMPDSSRPPQGRLITRTHLNYNNDYPVTVADLEDPASRLTTCYSAIIKTLGTLYYNQTVLGKTDWAVANDEGYDTPYNRTQMDALIAARPELAVYRAILYQFPVMAYARESRRIIGLHTLCAPEIERIPGPPIQFAHTVALADYAVDLHGSMTPNYLELDLDHVENIPTKFGGHGIGPFSVPFECFIPEKIDGFLPAEKNISQSRMANGATRLQPSTLLMGQAAGAIAALAIQHHIQPRAVDPEQVQRVLLDAGCTLSIAPMDALWGTKEWKQQQIQLLKSPKQ